MARKKRDRIDIADSGALSDLAFLLIIFFIVIAVFNVNKGFMLGLPKKNSTKIVNTQDIVRARLAENGGIYLDNLEVSIPELETKVKGLLDEKPNLTLLLKIEPDVPYQEVVNIIEIARKLEVENFSFSMTEEP